MSVQMQKPPDNTTLHEAVRAGCTAADVHLMCSYPGCACKQLPVAIIAAIRAWDAAILREACRGFSDEDVADMESENAGR